MTNSTLYRMKILSGGLIAAMLMSASVWAQDLEMRFRSLKLGLTRDAVVSMLGAPHTETDSSTFSITYERLTWVGPGGRRFVASFIHDRLWRWKSCSASVENC